jgi:hypothetical protein
MIENKDIMLPTVVGDAQAGDRHTVLIAASLSLFTFTVCYWRSFVFPHVPILPGGDQLDFVVAGSRIVAGELPYRDFFEKLPVGSDLTFALLIKWFGLYTWIPGLVMDCLAAAIVFLMTLVARRLMRGPVIVLPGLLLAGFVLPGSLDATHHWFSTLVAVGGMLVLLDGITSTRVAAAGALCGFAACFTQTAGAAVAAGFAGYLAWRTRQKHAPLGEWLCKSLLLCGAAAAVFAIANAYFIWAAGLHRWLFCVVIYPLRYFTAPAVNNWRVVEYDFQWHHGLGRWISFPFLYATVPLVYIVFVLELRRQCRKAANEPWDRLALVALTGFLLFLSIAPLPSVKRLSTVSPLAMVLLVWLFNRPDKTASRMKAILGGLAFALAIAAPVYSQTRQRAYLDLPAGRTAFLDPVQYDEYRWVLSHTHPGQYFFGMPPMYLPFHLLNPTAVEGFDPSEYTRPEEVLAGVKALSAHPVPLMILRLREQYLLPVRSPSDHHESFRKYLLQNYRLTRTFPNGDGVWERTDSLGDVFSSRPLTDN